MREEDHICDLPPPGTFDLGDSWTCFICDKKFQARSFAELAKERPEVYAKTYRYLKKRNKTSGIVVWQYTTERGQQNE